MTDVHHRPMHHDDDGDDDDRAGVAAASTTTSQPISSIRHGGGGGSSIGGGESLQVGPNNSIISTTSASKNKTIMNATNKEQPHKNHAVLPKKNNIRVLLDASSWSRRRQHQRNKQQQQQRHHHQQHVPPRLYYPFLIVLLVISFLSMSFSPYLVYNFLPDHHHYTSSSSSSSSSTSSFTMGTLLSSPLLEQQFHPKRITTAVTNTHADSDILKFSNKEEHPQQQQRHAGDSVTIGSVVSNGKDSIEVFPPQQQDTRPIKVVPSPIILSDNNNSTVSSSSSIIRPLRPGIDYEQYTVRINTWKRPAQLRVVLEHLSSTSCRSSIAQVQVIWCLAQGPVPEWLLQFNQAHSNGMDNDDDDDDFADFVVVEAHDENSLNERFNVLLEPPTYGILSVDDDVIRPCLALDAAFVKWTRNPHRMVGFDARSHVVTTNNNNNNAATSDNNSNNQVWAYGYLSTTQNMNRYSSSLTRFAFMHVDYLHSYMNHMPAQIRQVVAENLNCEDIAMSFWISKQASFYSASSSHSSSSSLSVSQQLPPPPPQPPLLADLWVMQSQVKLATGEKSISAGKDHKKMRDACVNDFSNWLQLKGQLKLSEWVHYENATVTTTATTGNHLRGGDEDDKMTKKIVFDCGAPMDASIAAAASEHVHTSLTARAVKERMDLWKGNMHIMLQDLKQLSADTRRAAKNQLLTSNSQASIKT